MDFFQTVTSLVLVVSLLIAWGALRASAKEAALRTRPWVGLTGVDYGPRPEGAGEEAVAAISLRYDNIGALPAQSVSFDLRAQPLPPFDPGSDAGFRFDSGYLGVFFPGEPGVQDFAMVEPLRDRLMRWLDADRQVLLDGTITYGFGAKKGWLGLWGKRTTWRTTYRTWMHPVDLKEYRAGSKVRLRWSHESAADL